MWLILAMLKSSFHLIHQGFINSVLHYRMWESPIRSESFHRFCDFRRLQIIIYHFNTISDVFLEESINFWYMLTPVNVYFKLLNYFSIFFKMTFEVIILYIGKPVGICINELVFKIPTFRKFVSHNISSNIFMLSMCNLTS